MFFAEVTVLLAPDGERLPPRLREPPMRGTVTFGEMNRNRDTSEAYTVTVDLWEQYKTPRMRNMAHMSMPFILPNGQGPGILISGIQREAWHDEDKKLRIKEHRQVWQVVPIERQGDE
jgi:hypothetical protein